MTEQDIQDFETVMKQLCVLFDKHCTADLTEIYFFALQDLSIDQFRQAAMKLANSAKFFPKPVEIRDAICGTSNDRASKAWDLFVTAVRMGGSWKSVYSADGALLHTVQIVYGSWLKACEMLPAVADPMFSAHRKQFIASYATAPARCNTHYLMGMSEANNRNAPKLLPVGQDTFTASVVCIGASVTLQEMEFSATTGALTEQSIQKLQSGKGLRLIAA